MANLHDFEAKSIRGDDCRLSSFEGKVCLVVNVASACGLTPQYDGLQRLYSEYHNRGLEILAFPCNQFGSQEPGTSLQISEFCTKNYGVTFDLFSKTDVNGDNASDLYKYLTSKKEI